MAVVVKVVGCCPAGQGLAAVHEEVPLFTQFVSLDLIARIWYEGLDPATDPRWQETGATSPAEYGFWSRRACGMACLQMVLAHGGRPVPLLMDMVRDGVRWGAYEVLPEGRGVRGMLYRPFVEYVTAVHPGVEARVCADLPVERLVEELAGGALVMASVGRDIRRPSVPAVERGGHLVLVQGVDEDGIHFLDPSGHTDDSRRTVLPLPVFDSFYAGRGVALRPV